MAYKILHDEDILTIFPQNFFQFLGQASFPHIHDLECAMASGTFFPGKFPSSSLWDVELDVNNSNLYLLSHSTYFLKCYHLFQSQPLHTGLSFVASVTMSTLFTAVFPVKATAYIQKKSHKAPTSIIRELCILPNHHS